jgi:hypothetical protein
LIEDLLKTKVPSPLFIAGSRMAIPLNYRDGNTFNSTFITLTGSKKGFSVSANPIRSIDMTGQTNGRMFRSSNQLDFLMKQINLLIKGKLDRRPNPIDNEIFSKPIKTNNNEA